MQYMYVHCILYCSSEKFKIVYLIPSGHHETLLKTVLPDTAPYCFAKSGPSYCFSGFLQKIVVKIVRKFRDVVLYVL